MTLAVATLTAVACGSRPAPEAASIEAARAEFRATIEDVTAATAYRYRATDDRGHVMDTAKIIRIPEAGTFAAVYHAWSDMEGAFHVYLATSDDLLEWTWQAEYAAQASQPTIAAAPDGGYVIAWEQEPDPIHIVIESFASWSDLRAGVVGRRFDVPVTLPACGEGTPSIEGASADRVDLAFHYHADCERDRQAGGSTDWITWQAAARPGLDQAVMDAGALGHIGDRDTISFRGHDLMLIEGQLVLDDVQSWRTFLYDGETGTAEELHVRTHAGSVALSNPTIERIDIDGREAILVTLYVITEGSRKGEDGELIYYRTLADDRPS